MTSPHRESPHHRVVPLEEGPRSMYESPTRPQGSTSSGPSSLGRRRPAPPPPLDSQLNLDYQNGLELGLPRSSSSNWKQSPPPESPTSGLRSSVSQRRPHSPRSNTSPNVLRMPSSAGASREASPRNFSRPLPGRNGSHEGSANGNRVRAKSIEGPGSSASSPRTDPSQSPFAKRLEIEALPKRSSPAKTVNASTSPVYPGLVLEPLAGIDQGNSLHFGVDTMRFDGPMDDILDMSAAMDAGTRKGSNTGQDETIAPWLNDAGTAPIFGEPGESSRRPSAGTNVSREDPSPTYDPDYMKDRAGTTREPRKHSNQLLNHFASVPSLPKSKRSIADEAPPVPSGSNLTAGRGSHPQFPSRPSSSGDASISRDASRATFDPDEGNTPFAGSRNTRAKHSLSSASEDPSGHSRQPSVTDGKTSRLGSVASTTSIPNQIEKKKGLFSGFIRRKTGQAASNNVEPDGHRGSASSGRLPSSASTRSIGGKTSDASDEPPIKRPSSRMPSYVPEGAISPLDEVRESDLRLDLNLEDMEGIVDQSLIGTPAASYRFPSVPAQSGQGTHSIPEPPGSMFIQDALNHTGNLATSVSSYGSGLSHRLPMNQSAEGQIGSSSDHTGSATSPFQRTNPFRSGSSSIGSIEEKSNGPPSPHNMSPKHAVLPQNQPRRPSQLRNVKMGSLTSNTSSTDSGDGKSLQPNAPTWAVAGEVNRGQTLFQDPFGAPGATAYNESLASGGISPNRSASRARLSSSGISTDRSTSGQSEAGLRPDNQRPSTAPSGGANIGPSAAWAAPESWGVEADAEPDDEASSDEWSGPADSPNLPDSPTPPTMDTAMPLPLPSVSGAKPPPFGYNSPAKFGQVRPGSSRTGAGGHRPRTRDARGRPGTARPGTGGRPNTSGSLHASNAPHWIRIHRADGSHSVMSFPLLTTTAEIISYLSGANDASAGKKVSTSMRLFVRERGQDRLLLPSEKPLAIQDRRLRQAGYTEAEHIEELGKKDLVLLCKFFYQTPVLPVMDPEESSYDSFEFIDIAGRALQTIPIFLHLHAHNIIILNVSRNPMTDLPLDFIQACSSLKELHMSYMALKRIPQAICASTTLTRLDVSCNRIADLESVPLHEIVSLTSLKVQNNKLASIPSYFTQMKTLKYLNISNNKFETFPAVLCSMSNLVDLDVSFNNIVELPSEMSELKSLERLAAFGNELTTFPSSFSTLASLRVLDVRRNKLADLSTVYTLPNLSTLQADNNNLATLDAQLGARVREFSVPHNSITRFTLAPLSSMVSVTYSLTHLNLSHGKISTLADEAFHGLVNLVHLNLNFNQLTRLPSTLGQLLNLEVFSCTDNQIVALPPGLGYMQKLREINFHNNNCRSIPGELWACSSLEYVNASSNLITGSGAVPSMEDMKKFLQGVDEKRKQSFISADGLSLLSVPCATTMRHCLLADNRFQEEIFHACSHLSELRTLNLSFNDIFEVPPSTLSKMSKLEALYLSGNKLTSLPAEDLEKMSKLRVLHLNGNKLKTLPSELGSLASLQHLDVGSNVLKYNIANWPYDWNWNWNTALRYLNLSGNKRLEIKPTSAQDMSHASASRKELSDFTALTELRVLGLMDVTLRIPSLPDESDEQRVRTSFSEINNMAYGIADMLGSTEHLAMFDLVVPKFRGRFNECLFGMFGRDSPSAPSGKIPKFLQDTFASELISQIDKLQPGEDVTQALRRAFLFSNRATFDHLVARSAENNRKGSVASYASGPTTARSYLPGSSSIFRTGSSGAVVYLVDKTLNVANVGDCLVVLSRKGEAELLSRLHDPTDRDETARIRRAEAWVSTKGCVNDEKDVNVSRAVGYFQTFPAINASPEIRTRQLTETDEFVIIGNHALWKWCSYQTAVDIARTERDDPMMAAQKLRDFAISYGADGSVMVMVVNVSDLFLGRSGQRPSTASGGIPLAGSFDGASDTNATFYGRDKRNARRRVEEVGDRTLNRLQQEIEPPQGQVAIVFTDIVNSTSLWETNQGMPTAIKMHHNLMRRQLRLDEGYEVKTEGDSFMVSFQTVASALAWAFNCQIGLLSLEWPRELLECDDGKLVYDSEGNVVQRGLRVRMGIHWGAPQCERDPITGRMDYYGPMVNRAARINASADGGQLMASQDVINEIQSLREFLDAAEESKDTADLPVDLKRDLQELRRIGFEVQDMGERKLKGLEVPEKLHLLYPKALSGRFELSNDLRANVEVGDARAHSSHRHIDIDQVRELCKFVLRLEGICSYYQSVPNPSTPPTSPRSPLSSHGLSTSAIDILGVSASVTPTSAAMGSNRSMGRPTEISLSPKSAIPPLALIGSATAPVMEQSPSRRTKTFRVNIAETYLGPNIRDDMGDEELMNIMDSLTTRLENNMAMLLMHRLGGTAAVQSAFARFAAFM
ncbi:hypothetical protein BD324DRAFT_333519 [Kockovaella imperatae]|uniref:Adenylate cyclase n=1 Tax=Kockovaella imperatae TaxID=4999 RepID=A0A1Y1UQN1_9TREE|nr:hypothetical protein BD324DRAFT_333519 [Kockovaella imperatae]ORX39455.1 hypothetical protein BD324DRAFT_333519 [Kockovaella imperatae]